MGGSAERRKRIESTPTPLLTLAFGDVGAELASASDWLLSHCAHAGLRVDDSYRIDLVVAEALGNIASYAYADSDNKDAAVELSWQQNRGGVMVVLRDFGERFDPARNPGAPLAVDLDQVTPGGMGLILMHRYSDAISYQRQRDSNQLTLYFAIPVNRPAQLGVLCDGLRTSGERLAMICHSALFRGLDESAVSTLLASCPCRRLTKGGTLLAEGQVNYHLYIVLSGTLAVMPTGNDAHSRVEIPAGECIGELSIIDGMPVSARVVASSDAEVLVVSEALLWQHLGHMPQLARNMLKVLAGRVRRQNQLTLDAMEQQLRFEHLQREMSLAANLQSTMLPVDFERFGEDLRHIDVHALMEPARDIGGDFYDIFMLGNDRFCVAVGDVSGKGMSAALFMVRSMTLLRTQVRKKRSLSRSMAQINRLLCENNPTNMFVTLVVAVISPRRRELRWVNGGHCAPLLLRRKGGLLALDSPRGILLGVDDSVVFEEGHCRFRAGDSLLLYSDGVTEAQNAVGELFGEQRLLQALDKAAGDNAGKLIQRVRSAMLGYVAQADVSDDITLLALRYQR